MPDLTPGRWTRRSALALGLTAVAVGLTARPAPAESAPVTLGDFRFDVPTGVRPTAQIPGLTRPWPWQGASAARAEGPPATLVLARADLDSTDAEEVLGLLLAGAGGGQLPGLVTQPRRTRDLGDGRGEQLRIDLSYQVTRLLRYRGTLLITTRPRPPAAVLVVLGDDTLTAGTVSAVLDSVRWTS